MHSLNLAGWLSSKKRSKPKVVNRNARGVAADTMFLDEGEVYTAPGKTVIKVDSKADVAEDAREDSEIIKGISIKVANKDTEGAAAGLVAIGRSSRKLNTEGDVEVDNQNTKGIAAGVFVSDSAKVIVTKTNTTIIVG